MRNIFSVTPAKGKQKFVGLLKQIWKHSDYETAKQYAEMIINDCEEKLARATECLEEGLEDSFQFYHFPVLESET
jgi:transposase-like protein